MKKITYIMIAAMLVMSMIAMTACSGGSLTADASDEKTMIITADKATEEHQVTVGTLKIDEGEQVTASADLEEGTLKIELFEEAEDQSIDELPDLDGDPVFMGVLGSNDSVSGGLAAGEYMARITPVEKATGSVQITAGPAK